MEESSSSEKKDETEGNNDIEHKNETLHDQRTEKESLVLQELSETVATLENLTFVLDDLLLLTTPTITTTTTMKQQQQSSADGTTTTTEIQPLTLSSSHSTFRSVADQQRKLAEELKQWDSLI